MWYILWNYINMIIIGHKYSLVSLYQSRFKALTLPIHLWLSTIDQISCVIVGNFRFSGYHLCCFINQREFFGSRLFFCWMLTFYKSTFNYIVKWWWWWWFTLSRIITIHWVQCFCCCCFYHYYHYDYDDHHRHRYTYHFISFFFFKILTNRQALFLLLLLLDFDFEK